MRARESDEGEQQLCGHHQTIENSQLEHPRKPAMRISRQNLVESRYLSNTSLSKRPRRSLPDEARQLFPNGTSG